MGSGEKGRLVPSRERRKIYRMSWLDGTKAASALRRGQRSFGAGDLAAAKRQCEAAIELAPRWVPPRLWLAQVLSELGQIDDAIATLEVARKEEPDSPMVYLWWGRALIDHQRFAEACEALESGVALGSPNLHLPVYLSLAEWAVDGGEESFKELEGLWSQAGEELGGRWLLLLEERFPGGPGTEFPDPGEPPESLKARFDQWRANRCIEKARSRHEREKHDDAVRLLERAEYLRPGAEEAHELAILVHRDAASKRREQLEKEPHDVDLRLAAADDLLEIGHPAEALSLLEPAAETIEKLDPHRLSWHAELALLSGRCLLGLESSSEAVEHLERARELWPTEVEPFYYLGVAHLRNGDRNEARTALVQACELDFKLVDLRAGEYRAAVL